MELGVVDQTRLYYNPKYSNLLHPLFGLHLKLGLLTLPHGGGVPVGGGGGGGVRRGLGELEGREVKSGGDSALY